jgi:CheY-like chemotaxis protein
MKVDLVLMDVMMPNMDGVEALLAIRALEASQGGHVPVIMATAHDEPGDAARYKRSGADGYLSKPLDIGRLQSEIGRVFAQR